MRSELFSEFLKLVNSTRPAEWLLLSVLLAAVLLAYTVLKGYLEKKGQEEGNRRLLVLCAVAMVAGLMGFKLVSDWNHRLAVGPLAAQNAEAGSAQATPRQGAGDERQDVAEEEGEEERDVGTAEAPPGLSVTPSTRTQTPVATDASLRIGLATTDGIVRTRLAQLLREQKLTVETAGLGADILAPSAFEQIRSGDLSPLIAAGWSGEPSLLLARVDREEVLSSQVASNRFVASVRVLAVSVDRKRAPFPIELSVLGNGGSPTAAYNHAIDRVPGEILRHLPAEVLQTGG